MSRGGRTVEKGSVPAVTDVLVRLKRSGCNLLVTGRVSDDAAVRATRQLMGSANVDRKRILVRTCPDGPPHSELLPSGVTVDDSGVRVVRYEDYALEVDPLAALCGAISDAVVDFQELTPLVSGELRLSIESLEPLISRNGLGAVEEFLHDTSFTVQDARGMGHYRFPSARSEHAALALMPVFDACIDLRQRENLEQRWHLPNVGTTQWVAL